MASATELLRSQRFAGGVALAALLAVLVAFPHLVGPYQTGLTTRILIVGLFGLAYNVVFGMGGMPSLGHAALFGAGSYVVALNHQHWEYPFATLVLLTLLTGALLGLVFGLFTLRTHGLYLLLLTLALGQAVWALAFQQVAITRGDNGIAGIARAIPGLPPGGMWFYYFVLAVTVASAGLLWQFSRSPVGRAIVGARESSTRMEALGYRVAGYRATAFVVSGTFSAVAGGLFAWLVRFVGPENVNWPRGAMIMIVAILGGAKYFSGPLLGAVVLITLESQVSARTDRWLTVLGILFILTILFVPGGLVGIAHRFKRWIWPGSRNGPGVDDPAPADTEVPAGLAGGGGP